MQQVAAGRRLGDQMMVVELVEPGPGGLPRWCRRGRRRRRRRCPGRGPGRAGGTAVAGPRSGPGRTGRTRPRRTGSRRASRPAGRGPPPARRRARRRSGPGGAGAAGRASRSPAAGTRTAGRSPRRRPRPGTRSGRPASRASSAAASAGARVSRLSTVASSSAVSRRRLVIRTRLPAVPGSSGLTCSCPAASSSSSRIFLPATWSRHRAARASRPGGMCCAATPAVSSRLASASAGSTGRWPGVWACSGQEELPVREAPGEPVRSVHRERRLADAGHAVDGMDRDGPAAVGGVGQRLQQPGQVRLAAGEAADIARQRPGRCGRRPVARPRPVPGRQDLRGRRPPAGRRDEQPPAPARSGSAHRPAAGRCPCARCG